MATIANLTVKSDDSFEGNLATLTVSAPIAIIENTGNKRGHSSGGSTGLKRGHSC